MTRLCLLRIRVLVTLCAAAVVGSALSVLGVPARAADAASCLGGAPGPGALCVGADLRGADLRGADLTGAIFVGADLRAAQLAGATLRGAILSGADLASADLSNADLTDAVLTGATWDGADLTGAHLPTAPSAGAAPAPSDSTAAGAGGSSLSSVTVTGAVAAPDPADGSQATFRLCAGAAPDTERAIEQFLAGAGFNATLTGRSDGCADLTVTRAPGGVTSGRQSTELSVSAGTASGGRIVVRIVSEQGTTRVSIGA